MFGKNASGTLRRTARKIPGEMKEKMKIALICIGDELLKGATVNTNLASLGGKLLEHGLLIDFCLEIPDTEEAIRNALNEALKRADIVLTSGGLGPTADDVTKEAAARRLGLPLEQDGETAIAVRRYWKLRHNEDAPPRILNQCLVPKNSLVIPNRNGTAPGLVMHTPANDPCPGRTIILMPGPPGEIVPMFENDVLPLILKIVPPEIHTNLFRICGIGESEIEERILPLLARTHPLSAAYCATHQFVKLFLNSPSLEILAHATSSVRSEFGDLILPGNTGSPAEALVYLLRERSLTLATAESCTGGLAAKLVTDIPGASQVFAGSVVSYSNRIKTSALGVKEETLKQFGAVSAETAREMAVGIASRFGVDCSISLTGIAGPDGGTAEKPVGLVYAGLHIPGRTEVREFHLLRNRTQIRERAAAAALNALRLMLLATDRT